MDDGPDGMIQSPESSIALPLISTRKIVQISMLIFAFLFPSLTWPQAAGCALLALLFNVVVLPRMDVDLRKRPRACAALNGGARSLRMSEATDSIWTGIVSSPISF